MRMQAAELAAHLLEGRCQDGLHESPIPDVSNRQTYQSVASELGQEAVVSRWSIYWMLAMLAASEHKIPDTQAIMVLPALKTR